MHFKLLMLALFFFVSVGAQELNKVVFDERAKQEVLVGECDRSGLTSPEFASFYNKNYNNYQLEDDAIRQIKKLRKDIEVVIVFGTWCHDTETQLPRFLKICDAAGFKDAKIKLLGVDSNKSAGDIDIEWLEISRVPTFIIYKNGREIGRIVEQPTTTLEKDFLMILTLGS